MLWASQVALEERTCLPMQVRRKRRGFDSWIRKIQRRGKWPPTPAFLSGESHGQRSLADYSPCISQNWTQMKRLSMHTHTQYASFSSCETFKGMLFSCMFLVFWPPYCLLSCRRFGLLTQSLPAPNSNSFQCGSH